MISTRWPSIPNPLSSPNIHPQPPVIPDHIFILPSQSSHFLSSIHHHHDSLSFKHPLPICMSPIQSKFYKIHLTDSGGGGFVFFWFARKYSLCCICCCNCSLLISHTSRPLVILHPKPHSETTGLFHHISSNPHSFINVQQMATFIPNLQFLQYIPPQGPAILDHRFMHPNPSVFPHHVPSNLIHLW